MRVRLHQVVLAVLCFELGSMAAPRQAAAFAIDWGPLLAAISSAQNALNGAIGKVKDAVDSGMKALNQMTGDGFTQIANNLKGQIGAQEQIADANNMVQARLARDVRNAQQRNQHIVNRQDCQNLEGGQAAVVAASYGAQVAKALDDAGDKRGQAAKGTPSWPGSAQGSEAANQHHFQRYCGDNEAEAGICTVSDVKMQGADQNASSLFSPVYDPKDKTAIDAANDYLRNLIQPVAPAAVRGSALDTLEGKSSLPGQRSYNAAMSLARFVGNQIIGDHAATVTLSAAQKAEAVREKLPSSDTGSVMQAVELEINRKYSGADWQADLQGMSSDKSVLIQIAMLDAQRNWLLLQQLKVQQQTALISASHLAMEAESRLKKVSPMSVP